MTSYVVCDASAHAYGLPKRQLSELEPRERRLLLEFGPPRQSAVKSDSAWIRGEPSCAEMQNARLANGIERFKAEVSYASDMGVDADVEAKVRGFGIKASGTYEAIRRRRWVFDVTFWKVGKEEAVRE